MKHMTTILAVAGGAIVCALALLRAADFSGKPQLDVLEMQQIPPGVYEVHLQLDRQDFTVRLGIKDNRAVFVKSSADKFNGFAGEFELIGNGVFLARMAGENHRATQWWVFHADGTASVKEVPDRGEKQVAKLVRDE